MGGNKEEVIRGESRRGEPEIVGLVQKLDYGVDSGLDFGLNCSCASWHKLCLTIWCRLSMSLSSSIQCDCYILCLRL